ncbi:MAG: GreA/GreB family elongation factor [Deinococcota bacterium]|nr:GreA/GreB family elongation factor [Deinococcota bacterium]
MTREVRLTQEGYDRLQNSLQQEYTRLEEATRILRELTGSSDDYDDSGLEDAKREKARLEQRIDDIEDQLARAIIIDSHKVDKVDLGAIITLQEGKGQESKGGEDLEVQLVSPIEASVLEGEIPRISDESPLGKALLGKKPGDSFKVAIGSKTVEYTVKAIS